jgi:hypothetical protein
MQDSNPNYYDDGSAHTSSGGDDGASGNSGKTTMLNKSVLGSDVRPGDTVKLMVKAVHGKEVEVCACDGSDSDSASESQSEDSSETATAGDQDESLYG